MIARRRGTTLVAAATAFLLVATGDARAVTVITGPDDICAPTDDPCVLSEKVENQAPGGVLDFGPRALRITGSGKILGSSTITCGDFLVEVGETKVAVDTEEPNNVAGTFRVTAHGRCSGDPSVTCLSGSCGGLGTCTGGVISLDGKIHSRGNPGGMVELRAHGDIVTYGDVLNYGTPTGANGGELDIVSYEGSIETNGELVSRAAIKPLFYETYMGGLTTLYSEGDITINGPVDVGGSSNGGWIKMYSGGGINLHNGIDASAAPRSGEATGGLIGLYADGDIVITGAGEQQIKETKLQTNGAGGCVIDYYYASCYVGYGGYTYLFADNGGKVTADKFVTIASNSGKSGKYGQAIGGRVRIESEAEVVFDGTAKLLGYTNSGFGGLFDVYAYDGIFMASSAQVLTKSKYGGTVRLSAGGFGSQSTGSELLGKIDVRGETLIAPTGYYYYYGEGGDFRFYGDVDLTIGGKILQGGEFGYCGFDLSACRMHLTSSALVDHSHGSPEAGGSVVLEVYESLYAAPGSVIKADAQGGGDVTIEYRTVDKPPVLLGNIIPPNVDLDGGPPGIGTDNGCSVCGNGEIDGGESCDDGNVTSGDGCRDDCHDEGCIADTPGFPGTALCDDGDACTIDTCDAVGHACINLPSCEEGVSCTVDACVLGACEHTPDDALCDDGNDCTDDLCNATTGCVHADLTGGGCEDGDLCTVTGTCDTGECIATDTSVVLDSNLAVKFRDTPGEDRLTYKSSMPLGEFTSNPTVTGLKVEMRDSSDATIYTADLPASAFTATGVGRYLFRDPRFEIPGAGGITVLKIVENPTKGIAKFRAKGKNVDLSAARDQFRLSVSLLFGADPTIDDCLTARFIPCEPTTKKNICKD